MIDGWVRFWAREEAPHALVAVRVALGLVVLWSMLDLAWHGLVPVFFSDEGVGLATGRSLLSPLIGVGGGWVAWGLMCALALGVATGTATPVSALLLVLVWVQWGDAMPGVNRAVDGYCKNLLTILAFSGCGRAWSVDARLRTGSFRGAETVGAWGRYLLIAQAVVMYSSAGLSKTGFLWTPMGSYDALYVLLQDPAIQRFEFGWLAAQPWLTLTRIGAAVTVYWQISYVLVPVFLYWRATSERGGFLRTWANRLHLDLVWIGVGVLFHLGLWVTTELGIFPMAMLSVYPALLADYIAAVWKGEP